MDNLNYGVIGNCRTAALVSSTGSIDWLCFPEFDSPSVFARLLDREKGGHFGIEVPAGYTVTQQYIPHTNILSTVFESEEGTFRVEDFMPRYRLTEQNEYYLPPEIHRYIRLVGGAPRLRVDYAPAPGYAREKVICRAGDCYIETAGSRQEQDKLYLYSGIPTEDILEKKEIVLRKDEFLLLSYNEKLIPVDIERVRLEYARTQVYWMNWTNRTRQLTSYNEVIERSMLVLKLMSYQNGAMLAALTTSLPESIGEVRNWDYRFCWLRDASMSIKTLFRMGHPGAAARFMRFIQGALTAQHGSYLIMYGIRGERQLTEVTLDHLSGYKNSKPVRVGNDAWLQRQNDSFGYLLDLIYHYFKYMRGTLAEIEQMWELVKSIMAAVTEDWRKPDKGIWEIRGEGKHFVSSKVMCWVALNRGMKIARLLHKSQDASRWKKEAALIRREVMEYGWNEKLQSFTQSYGDTCLDSSLLLMEPYGFLDSSDPRYRKTVKAVQRALFYKGLMYRYNKEDDFGLPSSAFTICTFWLIRALYVIGEKDNARQLFDRVLRYSNHLGLFSEDLDFTTKEQLGNFPQAYSHLAVINTAMLFAQEKESSRFRRP